MSAITRNNDRKDGESARDKSESVGEARVARGQKVARAYDA